MKSKEKLTSIAMSLVTLVTLAPTTVTPITTRALVIGCPAYLDVGDPNEDGTVDAADASRILSIYAEASTGQEISAKGYQLVVADVSKDGSVDATDASLILKHYGEKSTGSKISPFPVPKLSLTTTYTITKSFIVIDNYGREQTYEAFTPFKLESVSNGTAAIVIGNSFYTFNLTDYKTDLCVYPS